MLMILFAQVQSSMLNIRKQMEQNLQLSENASHHYLHSAVEGYYSPIIPIWTLSVSNRYSADTTSRFLLASWHDY